MYRVKTTIKYKRKAQVIMRALVSSHAAVQATLREIECVGALNGRVAEYVDYEIEALCSNPDIAYAIIIQNHPYTAPLVTIDEVMVPKEIENQISPWCNWQNSFTKNR